MQRIKALFGNFQNLKWVLDQQQKQQNEYKVNKMQNTQTMQSVQLFELAKSWKINKGIRKCKLDEHKDTIKYLRVARHFSGKQIHDFLNKNGVSVSYLTLMNYLKKRK